MDYRDSSNLEMDEMSIVNVFTKLIFDAQSPLNPSEEIVITILKRLEPSLGHLSREGLSDSLRSMSVDEMTHAVEKIMQRIGNHQDLIVTKHSDQSHRLSG